MSLSAEEYLRVPGWYYVYGGGRWSVAYWFVGGGAACWQVCGVRDMFRDADLGVVGLAVPMPTMPPPAKP